MIRASYRETYRATYRISGRRTNHFCFHAKATARTGRPTVRSAGRGAQLTTMQLFSAVRVDGRLCCAGAPETHEPSDERDEEELADEHLEDREGLPHGPSGD